MNWYKRAQQSLQQNFSEVRSALMALKYLRPDLDPLNADFTELSSALAETGKVPPGVDPGRFAARCVWLLRNPEGEDAL